MAISWQQLSESTPWCSTKSQALNGVKKRCNKMCNNKTFNKHIKSEWKMKKTMGSIFKEGKNDSLGDKNISCFALVM